jgi:flagellar basal-body rod protein FlgB
LVFVLQVTSVKEPEMEKTMEINNSLQSKMYGKTMDVLKRAIDYSSANQQVISGNMANVDTPGYRQMSLKFDEELLLAESRSNTSLKRTDSRHISGSAEPSVAGFTVETKETAGIDMDSEMAKMAKNNLLYEANTRLLTKKLLALKAAIKGSY